MCISFATTSIPKKAPPPPIVIEEENSGADEVQSDVAGQAGPSATGTPGPEVEVDPKQAFLQNIVEKLQEKVEKDIQRTLKVWVVPTLSFFIFICLASHLNFKFFFFCIIEH